MRLKSTGAVLTVEGHRRIKTFQTLETRNRKRIQTLYDQLGASYAQLYGEEQKEKHDIILRETDIQPSDVNLDLGCGTGALMTRIAHKSRLVVGIDIALSMVLATKKRVRRSPKCEIVWGDGRYLPFRQDSFQTLLAITVVLDPPSVSRTIDEAERILSSGGLAIVTMIRKARGFHLSESAIERDLHGWKVRKMRVGRDVGWFAKKA